MQNNAFKIYNASAGAGKTYTLVKEYLKIILLAKNPDAYRNILAITFTNKAVHEMKTRIVDNLFEFTKEKPNLKAQNIINDIHQETGLSLLEIKQKAIDIIKSLIHNYAAFDISTIDKFTHKIIRSFAHDLKLPVNFEVSIDSKNLLQEAIESVIAQAGEDNEVLTQLLVNFTTEKADDDKSWDVTYDVNQVAKELINENSRKELESINAISISQFIDIKKSIADKLNKLKQQSIDEAKNAFKLIDDSNIEHKSFYSSYIPNHFIKVSNGKVENNTNQVKYLEEKKYAETVNQNQKDLIDQIAPILLEHLKTINDKAKKILFYEAVYKNLAPLSLINEINKRLKEIQVEKNILSISEFNKIIHEQIKNQPAPFIYERLGEKFNHFFIDEFQDTSELQWQNLIPLIDNALSGEKNGTRGTLMIVGDPKQSIYRFRGGKAEQFLDLYNHQNPFPSVEKEIIPLQTNFRSYDEIISFNNSFFKWISSEFKNESYFDLYQNKSFQNNTSKSGGFVKISFLEKPLNEEVDEDVIDFNQQFLVETLNTIHDIKQNNFSYKDIVILTRNKDKGILIANYLIENFIPVISSESLLISNSSDVQCIIYILRYLNDSNDTESKANLLYYLVKKSNAIIEIHDFILQGLSCKTESDFESFLKKIGYHFSFIKLRKKPLFEATEIIIATIFKQTNAYIIHFLDIVFEHDYKKQTGILDFLTYWDSNAHKLSITLPEGNDAVKIMTVHKAKGLEFPVVIFPFANTNYSAKPRESMWLEANEEEIGINKALVSKSSLVQDYGDQNALVYQTKKEEELLDDINILYVCLTRAEEQLYIISEKVKPNNKGELPKNMATYFLQFLETQNWNFEKNSFSKGNQNRVSTINIQESNVIEIPQTKNLLNPENIKIAQRESLMWNTKQQKAIEYGNIIHEILAFIKTKNDINVAIIKAIENGLIISSEKEEVLKTISEIVNHKELTDYFSEENKVMNEQTIIQKNGTIVKPDRISISKDKKVYLLDYKTGEYLPKHKTQLENYQNTIEEMGYKVAKKSLIYIGKKIEIVTL